MKTAYTYTILRYVHDVSAGEFLNVGVVLLAPAERYLEARIQANYGRLRKAFPRLNGESHRQLMRYLQSGFDGWQMKYAEELPYEPLPQDVAGVAAAVVPADDSSLQWSPMGSGITDHPGIELERLYARFVTSNEESRADGGRSDEAVWSVYRAPLVRERVLPYLQPHKVVAENDEVEFEHAWKNHSWHCLQPFSLDYLNPESIKDKAHRLLGQMAGVRDATTDHRLYLMVGEPQVSKYRAAAERYLNLLHKELPLPTEIVRENEAEGFSREFALKIRECQHTALPQ